jgi:hypothetical protein
VTIQGVNEGVKENLAAHVRHKSPNRCKSDTAKYNDFSCAQHRWLSLFR